LLVWEHLQQQQQQQQRRSTGIGPFPCKLPDPTLFIQA
jgi:hypothetical protein